VCTSTIPNRSQLDSSKIAAASSLRAWQQQPLMTFKCSVTVVFIIFVTSMLVKAGFVHYTHSIPTPQQLLI